MGIFNNIRKMFRKGGALPHEHGPAVKFAKQAEAEHFRKLDELFFADLPQDTGYPGEKQIIIDVVKNPGTSATCVCGGGTCQCAKRKEDYAKSVAEKQKKATATKPVSKSQEKRIAIQKDIADAPLPKKPVSKKTITEPVAKKAPAKKVTKPVAKEAPKAEPKPAAKKPAPKKK